MNRMFHATPVALLFPLALFACGDAGTTGPDDTPAGGSEAPPSSSVPEVRADAPRAPAQAVTDTAVRSLVEGQNTFGLELYRAIATQRPGNLFCSTLSAHQALSMAYAGARGETRTEMGDVLHALPDEAAYHDAQNAVAQAVLAPPAALTEDAEAPLIRLQNALFPQTGLPLEPAFLDRLARSYGAGAVPVDYGHDAEGARTTINTWVSEVTAGRIPELLLPGQVNASTQLTLVNAVYFLGQWAEAFAPESTFEQTFHVDAADVSVPFMHHTFEAAPAAVTPDFTALSLPYAGGDVSFLAVQPSGSLADFEAGLTDASLADIASALTSEPTDVALPKLELRSRYGLKETLKTLGMVAAFSDEADFSGITTALQMGISEVIQEAWVKVDESGTEAAAATAIVFDAGAAEPVEARSVVLDRPFLFFIRHEPSGAVLFMGRVADPR